jgi:hypothetical protein
MPIEIKELQIKINVNETEQTNASPNKQAGGKMDTIVKSCVEEIMRTENHSLPR